MGPFPSVGKTKEKRELEIREVPYTLTKTLRPVGALEQCTYSQCSLKLDHWTPFPGQWGLA